MNSIASEAFKIVGGAACTGIGALVVGANPVAGVIVSGITNLVISVAKPIFDAIAPNASPVLRHGSVSVIAVSALVGAVKLAALAGFSISIGQVLLANLVTITALIVIVGVGYLITKAVAPETAARLTNRFFEYIQQQAQQNAPREHALNGAYALD